MGEAKRRAAAYDNAKRELLGCLAGDAVVIADAAIRLFDGFIFPRRYTGGCYLTTMFLHRFLDRERGIATEAVVGYVNDGTDDIMISHAWLEYGGRKVDLTLHLTEAPDVQLPGALIVLDQVLRPGIVRHSYHRERTLAGIVQDEKMMRDPHLAALLKHKAVEHQAMSERARDPDLMTRYLESAPEEMGYEAMAEVLRRFGPPLRRPC